MQMIPFNKPKIFKNSITYLNDSIKTLSFHGDKEYTKRCHKWIEDRFNTKKCLLTTSCTHALEMVAMLSEIKEGDEVIMPSYTFVSTANAFIKFGAKIIFIDIVPQTMNLNEDLIEQAITPKTKIIVPVHYAGVSCDMDKIMQIANKYNLIVAEDAAQGVSSLYKNRYLGTIGDFGCFSFHETKNYICGEGGALLINNEKYIDRAKIIREKGTNRDNFLNGIVNKYTWVDKGSSYLPSDILASILYGQLENTNKINKKRLNLWNFYYKQLKILENKSLIELQKIPEYSSHNAHMFFIKVRDIEVRTKLIEFLKKNNVLSLFHYIPLHSSPMGLKNTLFYGNDEITTKDSERLLRLPLYYDLTKKQIKYICQLIDIFFSK
ncbi:dTDP-4-amino-4,6-dideoxygalactose transaminase [Alphaproteobacteria bacterium]|nr:dTDP-4-amino-4,6-dideoxygalactose transaminase [Alphaproteobacteria bacterium]